ncbi:4Fe-4S binding protein [Desulfosarcina cetonica]|uniref:4Fe-4S binding protein n=1 Tax=Desulfosarcina cetonica TaxID=90730 RepID=UPI0006D189D4|nr:4Fe-4S binding protein [Desulfosarcina cetonica]
MKNAYVVYCSPAGSTGHVARVIVDELASRSVAVTEFDLGAGQDPAPLVKQLAAAGEADCLFVGSPVYRNLAVPPVMDFINSLQATKGCRAVPFITWGAASSGVALWQMGHAFSDKAYPIVGAAKVLGLHSLMWYSDDPVGKGHPDAADDAMVRGLVGDVIARMADGKALDLAVLDYQRGGQRRGKEDDRPAWTNIPKSVDADKCTACGACVPVCPVGAVSLDPTPVFGPSCIGCFNCLRECPEAAIVSGMPLEKLEAMIRGRVATLNETPPTQIFG